MQRPRPDLRSTSVVPDIMSKSLSEDLLPPHSIRYEQKGCGRLWYRYSGCKERSSKSALAANCSRFAGGLVGRCGAGEEANSYLRTSKPLVSVCRWLTTHDIHHTSPIRSSEPYSAHSIKHQTHQSLTSPVRDLNRGPGTRGSRLILAFQDAA